MASMLAPRVRIVGDAEFFEAWDLAHPGMEKVRDAVQTGDFVTAKIELKAYFLTRRRPAWTLNHWDMPAKPRGNAEDHSLYQAGEDILRHRFSGGGYEVTFGEKIDWNHFPLTKPDGTPDTEYPVIHYINRFHHVRTLGRLYWFSRNEKYAREFAEEVSDHVLSNPAPEDYVRYTAVWSKLTSISPVVGSWIDGLNYFLPAREFTPDALALMLKGIIEKTRYAIRNPDSVNRYMIQLRGIFTCGAYFPELKRAEAFRNFAIRGIKATIEDEFYPDGFSKELCPGYHGGSAGVIRGVIRIGRLMGYDSQEDLAHGIAAPYDVYTRIATPSRGIPAFGDTWGRGDLRKTFAQVVDVIDNPVYRWFVSDGKEGTPPAFVSTRLPWAGYYVMRSGWDRKALYLCFDAGPLGCGHWHEDLGNFECYAFGERLIGEVGVYSYTLSKWRRYFYSSLAHNVVIVDGLGQNRGCQTKDYALTDAPRTDDWHSDPVMDIATSCYDGLWGAWDAWDSWSNQHGRDSARELATHRRDIVFVKNHYWIIFDRLAAPGEHRYSQCFHFEPDRTVDIIAPDRAGTGDPGRPNVVIVQADPMNPEAVRGRETPPQGWYSARHGEIQPASMLSFNQTRADWAAYDTIVLPLDTGQEPEIQVERLAVTDREGKPIPVRDVSALRITTPAGTDIVINDLRQKEIGPGNGRPKRAGGHETDARTVVIRMAPDGRITKTSSVGGAFVR